MEKEGEDKNDENVLLKLSMPGQSLRPMTLAKMKKREEQEKQNNQPQVNTENISPTPIQQETNSQPIQEQHQETIPEPIQETVNEEPVQEELNQEIETQQIEFNEEPPITEEVIKEEIIEEQEPIQETVNGEPVQEQQEDVLLKLSMPGKELNQNPTQPIIEDDAPEHVNTIEPEREDSPEPPKDHPHLSGSYDMNHIKNLTNRLFNSDTVSERLKKK